MKDYIIRESRVEDIPKIESDLREADRREILSATGCDPVAALMISRSASDQSWTAIQGGYPLCIFGTRKIVFNPGRSVIWLIATNRLVSGSTRISFLRESRKWVEELGKGITLFNFVDPRNSLHIRWLEWLGFEFTGAFTEVADPSVDFVEYERRSE